MPRSSRPIVPFSYFTNKHVAHASLFPQCYIKSVSNSVSLLELSLKKRISKMRMSKKNWFGNIRKKLFRSHKNIILLHNNTITNRNSSANGRSSTNKNNVHTYFVSKEDMAAITIQSHFRGHLVSFTQLPYSSLISHNSLRKCKTYCHLLFHVKQ